MATKYWIKLYHEMLDDWKILSLPDSLKWRFVQCLLVAGELNEGGWLPGIKQFAANIRPIDPNSLTADLSRLAAAELVELRIDDDGKERWFIPNFEKRQARSANAKRQAEWRKREKEKKEAKKRKEEKEKKEEDIYIDIDTRNVTSNVTSNKSHNYTYTDHIENTQNWQVINEIAAVVQETYAPPFKEKEFEAAANAVKALDAVDRIAGFGEWWKKNGHYTGRPSLTSFLGQFQNYLDGAVITQTNGNGRMSQAEIKQKRSIDAIDRAFDEMEAQGLI